MTKNHIETICITLGIAGAFIILYGYSQASPQSFYICGSLALLITALHYKLFYFIALELILAAGHCVILLGIGPYIQVALPVLLCLQLLIFYLMISEERSIFLLLGIIGIAVLSLGFAYNNNQWIFFVGSSLIALYAYYSVYTGHRPAYLWAFLNTIFAVLALYKVFINFGI